MKKIAIYNTLVQLGVDYPQTRPLLRPLIASVDYNAALLKEMKKIYLLIPEMFKSKQIKFWIDGELGPMEMDDNTIRHQVYYPFYVGKMDIKKPHYLTFQNDYDPSQDKFVVTANVKYFSGVTKTFTQEIRKSGSQITAKDILKTCASLWRLVKKGIAEHGYKGQDFTMRSLTTPFESALGRGGVTVLRNDNEALHIQYFFGEDYWNEAFDKMNEWRNILHKVLPNKVWTSLEGYILEGNRFITYIDVETYDASGKQVHDRGASFVVKLTLIPLKDL